MNLFSKQHSESSAYCKRSNYIIHGFTLIELLVVVAIISVLVAMLLPALSSARDKARTVVCSTQVKQITSAMLVYAESDNNGKLSRSHWHGVMWYTTLLNTYLAKNDKIFVCPSDQSIDSNATIGGMNMSYGVSESGPCPPPKYMQHRINTIEDPCTTVLVCDSTAEVEGAWRYAVSGLLGGWTPQYYPGRFHQDGADVAFCDGHVQYMKWDDLVPVTNDGKRYALWYLGQTDTPLRESPW
jgi:prepilin-type N-terminal cleavage/methylation domain-containing protein/prepilin-type processing-associated H-X9-DG protein